MEDPLVSTTVIIRGGGGPTITGTTTLLGDTVTGIVVNTQGKKYITAPNITVTGNAK